MDEFLHAIFNGSKPKTCFCGSRPSIVILRAPLTADVPTHSFRYDECEMGVCGARRVVLWQVTEEKFRQHPSERTIVLVELAIVISPDSQIECCTVVPSKDDLRHSKIYARVNSVVMKRSPLVRQTASERIALEIVYPGHKPAPGMGFLVSSACRPTCKCLSRLEASQKS